MSPDSIGALLRILLDVSLRIVVVAGFVSILLRVARVRAGNLRHAAWTAVLASMLLMPVLTMVVPPIGVPLPSPPPAADADRQAWRGGEGAATPGPARPAASLPSRSDPSAEAMGTAVTQEATGPRGAGSRPPGRLSCWPATLPASACCSQGSRLAGGSPAA